MAHEIVHMLMGAGSHSDYGLMRPKWWSEDFRTGNLGGSGLSPSAVDLIRKEMAKRVAMATVANRVVVRGTEEQ